MELALLLLVVLAPLMCAVGITHVFALSWNRSSEQIAVNIELEADGEQNFDVTVPGSGNVVIAAEIDVSALLGVWISCDADIALHTNDDGTPDDQFTITADKPLVWYSGCGLPNPFASAVDVESFKAIKADADDATLKMRFLYDATP